jgi:hypothetical protein
VRSDASQGTPLTRVPVIPSSSGDMERCGHRPGGINQGRGHAADPGAMTHHDHAPGGVRTRSRRLDGLRADGAVSQAVVDERDDLSGDGDPGDLPRPLGVAVVGGDPGEVCPQLRASRLTLGCFDRCPAHEAINKNKKKIKNKKKKKKKIKKIKKIKIEKRKL